MIQEYDDILKEELDKISPLELKTMELTDNIAHKICQIMSERNITKIELARLTNKKPSEVTKWLSGGHNFTCKTIALISEALNEDIIKIDK